MTPNPVSGEAHYPEKYLRGIELFNQGDYFACHDEWEEHWMEIGPPHDNFYKGLIQAAIALHHLDGGNMVGAIQLYHGQKKYLEPYRPQTLGLDLDAFLEAMENAFREALEGNTKAALDPRKAPRIALSPSP